MAENLAVALRLTADGRQMVAEVKGAETALRQLGPAAEAGAGQAGAALRRVETQAAATGTALARLPAASANFGGLAQSAGSVAGVLTTVATEAASGGSAFQVLGRAGQVALGALGGPLGIILGTLGSLAIQYGVLALATRESTAAEDKYAEALRFAEDRMKTAEQRALDLAMAKRRQALETLEATKAIQQETLAQLQQDVAFARAGQESAAAEAGRPGRRGTLRQSTAQVAAGNRAEDLRQIEDAASAATAALEQTERAIAAVVAPSADDNARARAAAGRGGGGRQERAFDPFREFREAAARVERETRTPLEVYGDRLAELQTLVALGGLSQTAYNRAIDQAAESLAKASGAAGEAGTGVASLDRALDGLGETLQQTGKETSDYLAKAIVGLDGVRFSFDQLAAKFASGILSRLIQDEITGPLSKALVMLAKSGLQGLFGGGAVTGVPSTAGNLAGSSFVRDAGGNLVPALHSGGIAGIDAPRLRLVDPAIFRAAPRHHGGMPWLAPSERPAVLEAGEGVFTRAQMAALAPAGGGQVSVQVIDQRGAGAPPAEISETRGPDGMRQVRVLLRAEMAAAIADGGMDRSLRGAYGLQRRGA